MFETLYKVTRKLQVDWRSYTDLGRSFELVYEETDHSASSRNETVMAKIQPMFSVFVLVILFI
jgi:hypothetical protein